MARRRLFLRQAWTRAASPQGRRLQLRKRGRHAQAGDRVWSQAEVSDGAVGGDLGERAGAVEDRLDRCAGLAGSIAFFCALTRRAHATARRRRRCGRAAQTLLRDKSSGRLRRSSVTPPAQHVIQAEFAAAFAMRALRWRIWSSLRGAAQEAARRTEAIIPVSAVTAARLSTRAAAEVQDRPCRRIRDGQADRRRGPSSRRESRDSRARRGWRRDRRGA